jgi:primosomal protein N' (replication factor Y)
VEKEVEKLLPSARIQRMDSDTTAKRDSHVRMFAAFRKKEIDILLGTQMIAKGLDFPEVTLVGVISADTSLNFPDFRSSERTFQLLTQVAGRAGRGSIPGKVIIQTYNPGHYAIAAAKSHDYEGFYKQELEFRRELLYPPFTHFATLTVSGLKQEKVESSALVLKNIIIKLVASGKDVPVGRQIDILGPAPAPLSRIKRKYRWHLTLKAARVGRIHEILTSLREEIEGNQMLKRVNITIDVDPVGML